MNNFNLLPIDVINMIIDIYYTPIIKSFEQYISFYRSDFYLEFFYPTHHFKIKMSLPHTKSSKGSTWYVTDQINEFIGALEDNENYTLYLTHPSDLDFILDENYIHVINEDVHMKIKNTEKLRNELVYVIYQYKEFVESQCY